MKFIFTYTWLFIFALQFAQAQNTNRIYQSHQWNGQTLTVQTNEGTLQIQTMDDKILEISFLKSNEKFNNFSHSVVLSPRKIKAKVKEQGNVINLSTKSLSVIVQKIPFQVRFDYRGENSKTLITEKTGFFDRDTLKGFEFNLDDTEALYGTGERALPLNRRGNRLEIYNKASYGYETFAPLMYYNMPLVMSSKCYMIYFDNAPKGFLDLGKTEKNTLSFESIGGKMTYYLLADDDFDGLTGLYTQLTGKQPLPPRWAFGNFASRYGYRSEKEVRNTIDEFFKLDIPVSAVVLDHYWYGEGEIKKSVGMGDLDWYRPSFPTGEKMVQDFKSKGIETVMITQPFVLTNSKNFGDAVNQKLLAQTKDGKTEIIPYFYFGETGLIDIFKPEAKQWFWQKYKTHIKNGMYGWWGDLGEPEVHPATAIHQNDKADEVHNIYGHEWAKMLYENFAKDFPNVRPFTLMRAGAAGSQRFGMIPWSGDVSRSWGGLQAQPALILNMNLGGLAYMHSDLGGFAGGEKDAELYLRWLQFGLFQPIFRPHGQEQIPSEPVFWEEETRNKAKAIIRQRYQMLPYNYSIAFKNAQKGKLMMRPVFFEDANRIENLQDASAFFWGDAFLVAPILEKGQKQKQVYLPKGTWFDFYTNQKFEGGQVISKDLTMDNIPTFVRAGAFVPLLPENTVSNQYKVDNLVIHYYAGAEGEFDLYEDDGLLKNAFQKRQYEIFELEAEKETEGLEISIEKSKTTFPNAPKTRNITLKIIGLDALPTQILLAGKPLKVFQDNVGYPRTNEKAYWDLGQKILEIQLEWKGKELEILLK